MMGCLPSKEGGGNTKGKLQNLSNNTVNNNKKAADVEPHVLPEEDHIVTDKEMSYEQARSVIDQSMQYLENCSDYSTNKAWVITNQLAVASCVVSSMCVETKLQLANHLVKTGFAPLFMKVAKALQGDKISNDGTQKEDSLKVIKGTCINFSNSHEFEVLVLELVCQGAIDFLLNELDELNQTNINSRLIRTVTTLNILSNCVQCSDNLVREAFRNANAVTILMKYLTSDEIKLKMESLSILAYIVNEDESDILARTSGCILHLVNMLKRAITADDFYVHYSIAGEPCGDGVYGLIDTINRLVVSDSNKEKIVQHEGIPTITNILKIHGTGATDSQQAAMETLWKLAFVDSHQQVIRQYIENTNTDKVLSDMHNSAHPALRDASTGLLWKLGLIDTPKKTDEEKHQETQPDDLQELILFSYSWSNHKQVLKVADKLKAAGFNVWMKGNEVEGNILSAMTESVQSSAVVLMCISSKYKESVYCQTEANYASELQKPIIPVLIEKDYKIDGWLGEIIPARKQFQAYSDDVLQQEIDGLIEETWTFLV